MKKGIVITFASMMGAGLLIFYCIQAGFYPVAIVGGRFIAERGLNEASASVFQYYTKMIETYSDTDPKLREQQISLPEVRRATLDKMIENVLIENELSRTGEEDIEQFVEGEIAAAEEKNPAFRDAVGTLYGLSLERFKEVILKSQVREERLREKKSTFTEWILEERKAAHVVVLAPDLRWDGEKVVNR